MRAILIIISPLIGILSAVGQTNMMNYSSSPVKGAPSDFHFAPQSSGMLLQPSQYSSGIKQRLDSIIITWDSYAYKEKRHFLYNSEGYNTEWINYKYDMTTFKWVQSGNVKCNYDSVWNLTSVVTEGEYKNKVEYKYDKKGNLITVVSYQWNNTSGWYEIFSDVYKYDKFPYEIDAITHIAEHCKFRFDNDGKIINIKWVVTDSIDFRYDINGNIISRTRFFYDPGYCPFVVCGIEDYNYDLTNNTITAILKEAQLSGMCYDSKLSLKNESKYTIDKGYRKKDLILPYVFYNNPFAHYIDWLYTWNFLLDFKITERTNTSYWNVKYYYSDQTITDNNDIKHIESRIFPNPATDKIYFDINKNTAPVFLEILDVHGRTVMKDDISGFHQISVGHLKRGIYIYKLYNHSETRTGKILLH